MIQGAWMFLMKSTGIIQTLSKYAKFLQESTLKRNVNLMNSLPCKINHLFKEKVKFAAVLCSNTLFSSYVTKRWKPWSPNKPSSSLATEVELLLHGIHTHTFIQNNVFCLHENLNTEVARVSTFFPLLFFLFTYSLFLTCRISCCLV